MKEYKERTYRKSVHAVDLVSFHVAVKETDLWISAGRPLEKAASDLVFNYRHQLENYIESHPSFLTSVQPYPEDIYAPPIVRRMIEATEAVGVGPMASVAGAVAQFVGRGLLELTAPFSERIGIVIPVRQMPIGVCSSSGKVGHSFSMGVADVVCLLSPSALIADGAATALGNRIKGKKDLEKIAIWANDIKDILGGLAIVEDRMATWGDIELLRL
jgi:ApbE superfamily uncharacterized protein (UPF0280 family)